MRGGKKIGGCAFACILTPSPFGHSPYIPCRNTGERLRCIPLSPLLRFYTEYPAMLRDTAEGEEAYPCHYRYRYYLTLPSLRATSSIFRWAKHPVMLRDTVKEEENTPQSSEGIKRFKVILSILSLCSSQMR